MQSTNTIFTQLNNDEDVVKPRVIYKYHSLSIYLMEMMTSSEFYMSKKSDLNDPLDSTYTIEVNDYLNLYLEKYPSFKNDKEQIERAKFLFELDMQKFDNHWMHSIDEFQSKLRVSCFTEDGNNYLMWSHYGSNHTGVCLKFDTDKDENLKNSLLPVEYRDELIKAKKLEDFKKCLLTKLRTWNIEKEWRIISEKEKFPFKQEALVEITFGLKVPDSTIKWFKYFSESAYFGHAPIYRLKLMGNKLVKVNEYDELIV